MAGLKVLAVAVATGRAGFVYIEGMEVRDWGMSMKAVQSTKQLVAFLQEQIDEFTPDVVVTEKCEAGCRKGKRTKSLINAAAEIASHNEVLDVSVDRPRRFPSKYDEATDLVTRHPSLAGYLPKRKRRIFDFEPRGMVLFEALAMAERVIHGPPDQLAAAMG
jgi:hypothetical protein